MHTAEPAAGNARPPIVLPAELAHIAFTGGSGRDCEHAVRIEHARNSGEAMLAQKVWVRATYPGARPHEHAVSHKDGRMLEVFSFKLADGGTVFACFDVTETFGRW